MIMLPNLLNNGAIANEASKQASSITGSLAPGIDDPLGSIIIANFGSPSEYVLISVEKSATSCHCLSFFDG